MFGTDLPSTRAPRPFEDADVDVVRETAGERALWQNAADLYLREMVREIPEGETTVAAEALLELRGHHGTVEALAARIDAQRPDGYRVVASLEDGVAAAVAGFRVAENAAWGRFLYVDDLVTRADMRGRGSRRRRDGLGRSGGRAAAVRRTAPGLRRRARARGRPPVLLPPRDADHVVPLRQESRMIGTPRRRRDGDAKVRGATRYVADMPVHGLLHARPVLAAEAHARITGIDGSAALDVPGVVAVLTAADLPLSGGSGRTAEPLAREEIVWSGQPVALVIAESEAAAEDGAMLVVVDAEPLPAVLDIEAALAAGAPPVRVTARRGTTSAAGAHTGPPRVKTGGHRRRGG